MKIAVIGATGYVGNAVVQELAGRGHEVTAFGQAAHGGKMRAGNAVGNVEEIAFFTILQGGADR